MHHAGMRVTRRGVAFAGHVSVITRLRAAAAAAAADSSSLPGWSVGRFSAAAAGP